MSTQIKKNVFGPLTTSADSDPAVKIVFPDGSEHVSRLSDFKPEVVIRLALHGLSQKLGDSYAGAADEENPLGYAKESVTDVHGQLVNGDWRVTGTGGSRITLLARALARATGQTVEAAQGVIDVKAEYGDDGKPSEAGKAFLKAVRADAAIKAAVAEIKLEDAQKAKAKLGATGEKADVSTLGALFTA